MNIVEPYDKPKYRYPGAQPFAKEQKGIFYGREKDVKKIIDIISIEDLFVLYSKSGVGKSSILNAAIIPKLEDQLNIAVHSIRFGAFNPSSDSSPLEICHSHLTNPIQVEDPIRKVNPNENSLWYHIKQLHNQNPAGQFVLVFDQFEELFTYPEGEVSAFKKELAELINTQIPERIRLNLEKAYNQNKDWISDEAFEALHIFPEVKVIMAIRSDRLALLNQLSDELPTVLKVCYELQHLNIEDAEDAILNPAFKRHEGFISIPFDYEDNAIDAILGYLSNDRKDKIESVQLQIICQAMEQKVIQNKLKRITTKEVEGIDQIYTNYYTNQIAKLSSPMDRASARVLIEEGLIFEEEERRLSLYEGQIYKNYNIRPEVLRNLVDIHLLRAEPSMRGGYAYEITHDSVVPSILEAKRTRIEQDKKRAEAALKAIREQELSALTAEKEVERRKKVIARSIAALAIFFALLASVSAVLAFQQTQRAVRLKNQAEKAKQTAYLAYRELGKSQYSFLLVEGENQFQRKNYNNAFKLFNQAVKLAESLKIDSGGLKAKETIKKNQELQQRVQRYDQLISDGDQLLTKGGSYTTQALKQFQAALNTGVNDRFAKIKIEDAKAKIEADYNLLIDRGTYYVNNNQLNEACNAFRLALKLKPKDPIASQKIKEYCSN